MTRHPAHDPAKQPALSAVLVVGPLRSRGQRVVDALCAQTIAAQLEIVVVDLAPGKRPHLVTAQGQELVHVEATPGMTVAQARAAAVAAARAPVVAFLKDHCFPDPDWAELLVAAHEGPWAAVGFGLRNANPESYVSRASMIAGYGFWADPAPTGETTTLPSHNVSFKRAVLTEHQDRLGLLLAPDHVLYEVLLASGRRFYLEGRARATYENATSLVTLLGTSFAFCRLYAGQRVRLHELPVRRRLVQGVLAVTLGPWQRLRHLGRALAGRGLWPAALLALPVVFLSLFVTGVGLATGYALGAGTAEADLARFDFDVRKGS